jgi:hypothetical protein
MRVAIVGGAPNKHDPFSDTSCEVWVHGNQMDRHKGKRISRIFEIHDDLSEHQDGYAAWLVEQKIPLVVGRKFPFRGEGITTYPYDAVNAMMGQHLTSTPAYMMALAILEGATHISIYGVEMSVDDHEYFYQRPSMYAWIAYAKAKGIEVYIPPDSGLFVDTYVEGNQGGKPNLGLVPFTEKEFSNLAAIHGKAMSDIENQILQLQMKMNAHSGSKQTYERLAKIARGVEGGATVNTLTENMVIR